MTLRRGESTGETIFCLRTLVGAFSARGLRGGDVTRGRNAVLRIIGTQVCNLGTIAGRRGAAFCVAIFLHKRGDKSTINTR
jgi:hypothetical protein